MALSRAFMASLLLVLLFAGRFVDSHPLLKKHHVMRASRRSLLQTSTPIDCAAACKVRCSKSWKPKMCHRACGTCCARCSCVPPGTSVDTRGMCPCYATMTTHGGRLKCP